METTETKEVALAKTQAGEALKLANALIIKTPEDMQGATDGLSGLKTIAKMVKERKEAITKPLNEALSSARDLFKPIEANLADAERIVKGKMLAYSNAVDAKAAEDKRKLAERVERSTMKPATAIAKIEAIPDQQKEVKGAVGAVQFRMVKKYRVVDASLLPREFLTPDMAKITEVLKAGQTVPGAEVYEEKVIGAR